MSAPIPQILLAYEGRIDFVVKTNPFGGGSKNTTPEKPKNTEKLDALRTQFALAKLDARSEDKFRE